MIYTLTQRQKDQAEEAHQEFAEILAADPTAKAPASFRQMILNEKHGWTWNPATQKYEPENK